MPGQLSPGPGDRDSQLNDIMTNVPEMAVREVTKKFKGPWANIVNNTNFATYLSKRVGDLFDNIATALEQTTNNSSNTSPIAKDAVASGIETFLFEGEGDGEANHIDPCILWLLLYWAAEMNPENSKTMGEADRVVCNMIIKKHPYLAFDNPHNLTLKLEVPGRYKSIRDQCSILNQRWVMKGQKNKEFHFQDKVKTTPFHHASKHGNFAIIKLMRDSLSSIDEAHHCAIHAVIQGNDPGKAKTALKHAVEAEHGSVETLRELLGFPCLASSDQLDEIFAKAVREGRDNVVDAFLDQEKLKERFVKSEHILTAIQQIPHCSDLNDRRRYMRIIKKLIEMTVPTEPLTDEVVESIVEQQSIAEGKSLPKQDSKPELGSDWMDIWKAAQARPKGVVEHGLSNLLHLAVYHQSLFFVTECLQHQEYSKSVTVPKALPRSNMRMSASSEAEYFPLWYNSKVWNDKVPGWIERDGSATIRTMLVSTTIRQTSRMQQLSDIFYKSDQPVRELCFDISRFNSKLYSVSDFVHSLIHHSESKALLSYEETIRYAEFPALDLKIDERDTFGDNTYLPVQHTEVFDILTWLWQQKGVRRIVELKVPDRLVNPHSEERIAKFVDMFEVERLDWRCLDLSLSVFGSCVASDRTKVTDETKINDKIKELHLYSSGRRAAIDHWLGSGGIPTLTKLETLHIHIVRETVTEDHCKDLLPLISNGLQMLTQKYAGQPTCNFKVGFATVDSVFWNPTHILVDLDEMITPRLAKFLKSLSDFVPGREKQVGRKLSRTRVAIIDNGILSITPRSYDKVGGIRGRKNKDKVEDAASIKSSDAKGNSSISSVKDKGTAGLEDDQKDENVGRESLWSRIKAGRSFVDDGSKVCPWLFASDSHGTQMANLICAMDPFCELYVARVAEGKYGITPDRTARAIEWALEKKVDIISMSIALLDPGKDDILQYWVNKAKEKGVIIVCSTHDEGTLTLTSYPADWKAGLIVVTACDEYGQLLRIIEKEKFNYKVQGQNVAAGVIPFVQSSDYVTGSSVSTALTAGLSSLILTCHKVAHLRQQQPETRNEQKVDKPGKFPYAENQLQKVNKHLDGMANNQHIVLEKFGKIDSTTKEGDEIVAGKILQDSFHMSD